MMSRPLYGLLTAGLLFTCSTVKAQTQNKDILDYIARYSSVAIEEQQRTGIPAAITLAQGIHESACGKSELSLNAHNHFGIKCKNTWTGETYTYTDDAKDECFRKYESDMHSYKDHSDFLKGNARYAALFALEQSDYKGWAFGLKKCGYATNPQYAIKLIDLIERYDLQQYTLATNYQAVSTTDGAIASTDKYFGVSSSTQDTVSRKTRRRTDDGNVFANVPAEEDAAPAAPKYTMAPAAQGSTAFYELTTRNGLKGFYAPKGELLLSAANKFNIRYAKLLDINDLADAPLPEDMFIYLSRKNKTGYEPTHTVKYGETVSIIAQDQGMRMKDLLAFNQLLPGEEPAEGSVLYLQGMAPQKPDLSRQQFNTSKYNTIDRGATAASGQEYIATGNKPKYTSEPNDPKMKALQEQEMAALDKRTQEAAATEEYNIANEPAVEDQMAAERNEEEVVPAAPVAATEELSSLDKLKAKLDRSVYGNKPPADQNVPTRPAASRTNTSAPATANPEVNPAASIDTRSAHASLKSKIDQHQKEIQDQPAPVVEQYSAPQASAPVRTPAPNVTKSTNGIHVVKKGDTAFSIAKSYGISLDQLIKWNKLPSSGAVTVGSKLKVK